MQLSETHPNRICRIVEGEAIILDTEAGLYYALNTTATDILAALQEGKQPAEVLAWLHDKYQLADSEFTMAELQDIVTQLKEEGLWEATIHD